MNQVELDDLRARLEKLNQKEKNIKKDFNKSLKIGAGGVGMRLAGIALAYPATKSLEKGKSEDYIKSVGSGSELYNKLAENHKDKINIVDSYQFQDKKGGNVIVDLSQYGAHYNPATRGVYIPKSGAMKDQNDAGTLAHELGHAKIHDKLGDRMNNAVTTAQGLAAYGSLDNRVTLGLNGPVAALGYKMARDKYRDKKTNKLLIAGALAPQIIVNGTMLANEAAASISGLRDLKKLGASKDQMKRSRNDLLAAYGTYVGASMGNASDAMLSYAMGRGAGNKRNLRDLNKEREKLQQMIAERERNKR